MDTPFTYDRHVTGKNFIGKKDSCNILANLLSQMENVVIYEPPRSGKTSVIQQSFYNLRLSGRKFVTGELSALDIRDLQTFLIRFGTAAIKSVAATPVEFDEIVTGLLAGTHFVFDVRQYAETGQILSLNWDPDLSDAEAILRLPDTLGLNNGLQVIMLIDEFQNLDFCPEADELYHLMEKVMRDNREQNSQYGCTFLLCGSKVNAMADIFRHRHFFYRLVERFEPDRPDEREITEYIVRGFLSSGKVLDRELMSAACRLLKNDLWYINHLVSICDSMSKGYITETTMSAALETLISIHEPRFRATMNDLTTFQVNLLKAIVDNHKRFSSADVIREYHLNSSANVRRLKDALMKKEIVTFNEQDEPEILDPLFEYWVKRDFFHYTNI